MQEQNEHQPPPQKYNGKNSESPRSLNILSDQVKNFIIRPIDPQFRNENDQPNISNNTPPMNTPPTNNNPIPIYNESFKSEYFGSHQKMERDMNYNMDSGNTMMMNNQNMNHNNNSFPQNHDPNKNGYQNTIPFNPQNPQQNTGQVNYSSPELFKMNNTYDPNVRKGSGSAPSGNNPNNQVSGGNNTPVLNNPLASNTNTTPVLNNPLTGMNPPVKTTNPVKINNQGNQPNTGLTNPLHLSTNNKINTPSPTMVNPLTSNTGVINPLNPSQKNQHLINFNEKSGSGSPPKSQLQNPITPHIFNNPNQNGNTGVNNPGVNQYPNSQGKTSPQIPRQNNPNNQHAQQGNNQQNTFNSQINMHNSPPNQTSAFNPQIGNTTQINSMNPLDPQFNPQKTNPINNPITPQFNPQSNTPKVNTPLNPPLNYNHQGGNSTVNPINPQYNPNNPINPQYNPNNPQVNQQSSLNPNLQNTNLNQNQVEPDQDLIPSGELEYEFEIARGTFGVVYKGTWHKTGIFFSFFSF